MKTNANYILIAVVAFILGAVVFMYAGRDHRGPAEKIGGSIDEVAEEIQDEIDDNTTAR